jgi:ADP-ribosylglycohydrolase
LHLTDAIVRVNLTISHLDKNASTERSAMDHLDELDALIGPVAVMDLDQRGLLPPPGKGQVRPSAPGARDRSAGALVGAAIGSALAHPMGGPGGEVRMLVAYAEAVAENGRAAAPAFADQLLSLGVQVEGQAVRRTVRHRRQGAPWYAAAPPSFGGGAVLRAVADGVAWRSEPRWRPLSAALGAVVTHAHPEAVDASRRMAKAVARLVNDPRHPRGIPAGQRPRGPVPPTASACLEAAFGLVRRHPNAEAALLAASRLDASAHLVAPLVGALVGARAGIASLPRHWVRALPGPHELEALARRLDPGQPAGDGPAPGHVWFLLDRSGSMSSLRGAVVEGFNAFVAEQRDGASATTRLTLAQFDSEDPFEVVIDDQPIGTVRRLRRFEPRGMTPLYDAIGSILDAAERPDADEDHLVVIFTDGLENASRRWSQAAIFDRIRAKKAEGWTFVFMGANQDSYASGASMGVDGGSISNYAASPDGVRRASASLSRATRSWRQKDRAQRRADQDDFFEGLKEAE